MQALSESNDTVTLKFNNIIKFVKNINSLLHKKFLNS